MNLSVEPVVASNCPRLNGTERSVDIESMIDADFSLALNNPAWIRVLRAYHSALQEPEAPGTPAVREETGSVAIVEAEDSDVTSESEECGKSRRAARWLARIHQIEGLAKDELSRIHGRLIAYGFLKCDLAERTAEVVYQLTLAGKQVVNLATTAMGAEPEPLAELTAAA